MQCFSFVGFEQKLLLVLVSHLSWECALYATIPILRCSAVLRRRYIHNKSCIENMRDNEVLKSTNLLSATRPRKSRRKQDNKDRNSSVCRITCSRNWKLSSLLHREGRLNSRKRRTMRTMVIVVANYARVSVYMYVYNHHCSERLNNYIRYNHSRCKSVHRGDALSLSFFRQVVYNI